MMRLTDFPGMTDKRFDLAMDPFRLSPDFRFCFRHERYFQARSCVDYAFQRGEGFVLITGEPGTGKTTLVQDLVDSLPRDAVMVGSLVSTQMSTDDLLRMVAFAFGVSGYVAEKAVILHSLRQAWSKWVSEGGRVLLIVDEAQNLHPAALEELRMLTNFQQDGRPLIQVFLLGQPELLDLVHKPGLEQFQQRVIAASKLAPLRLEETASYVQYRLRKAGWRGDPALSSAIYPIIHRYSGGIPRRINLVCSRLLLQARLVGSQRIGVADARLVVAELQEEQLSTRDILKDEVFFCEDVFDSEPASDPAASGGGEVSAEHPESLASPSAPAEAHTLAAEPTGHRPLPSPRGSKTGTRAAPRAARDAIPPDVQGLAEGPIAAVDGLLSFPACPPAEHSPRSGQPGSPKHSVAVGGGMVILCALLVLLFAAGGIL
jgi:type II secretory pathway predicted ATPase ExeA